MEFKNGDFIKPGLRISLFHLQIGAWRNAINSRRVSKLQSMTNARLGFLLQELGEKRWELSRNRGAVNWKPRMGREKQTRASVPSFLWSKACPALHGEAEGHESAASQPSWGLQSCRSVLLCSGQPWHRPRWGGGERDSSPSIPVTSSSSHTAGSYLGWDHQLGKQEKEMGTWWATPGCVLLPPLFLIPPVSQCQSRLPLRIWSCPNQDMLRVQFWSMHLSFIKTFSEPGSSQSGTWGFHLTQSLFPNSKAQLNDL